MFTIRYVTIIGAGTMGGGIAIGCLLAGIMTTVVDTSEANLDKLVERIKKHLGKRVAKGSLTDGQSAAALKCLRTSTEPSAVETADLVIEAVYEELSIKQTLFKNIDEYLPMNVIIATNTSALRVSELATALTRPELLLGLHYFSPAEVNPLVEVVRGAQTDPALIDPIRAFLAATKKTALDCKDSNGFAVNRFFCPYTNEAVRLVDEGFGSPAQIDALAREVFDLAIGPFAVMNIIKPRINLKALINLSSLGEFYHPADGLIRLGEADESWDISDEHDKLPDESEHLIKTRLLGATFVPILEALAEHVATPEAFDIGARLALRFRRLPVAYMRDLGREELVKAIQFHKEKYTLGNLDAGMDAVFANSPSRNE